MMRKLREQLLWASVLTFLALALGAQPGLANDVDVSTTSSFGVLFATQNTNLAVSGQWSATLSENVYKNGNVYTYVFTLANLSGSVPLSFASTATLGAPNLNKFDSSLNWGVVTGLTGTTSTCLPTCTNTDLVNDSSFNILATSSFQATFTSKSGGLPALDQITFYAQGGAPVPGTFGAQDGGVNNAGASLDPGPEPASILLFGTGLLMMGVILRRRLPQLPQLP